MARKVTPRTKTAAATAQPNDLAILHPEATITIGGRTVTVREYGMIAGLQLRQQVRPFSADLADLFDRGECSVEDVVDVVAKHLPLARIAIAASMDVAPEWLDTLDDTDGDLLLNTWWGICGPFFMRPLLRRKLEQLRRAALAGAPSTLNSPQQDSAPPNSSGATPSGN